MRAMVSGVKDLLSALTAEECGANFISFVFEKDSKDCVTPNRASVIAQQIPDTRRVGVFKDEKLEVVNGIVSKVGLDYVELEGHENNDYIRQVNCPVIKRYDYDDKFSVAEARESAAEMIMLDISKCDYRNDYLATDLSLMHKSVIVSGDITKGNAKKIYHYLHPYAVNVSECLEINGEKDVKKIQSFFRGIGHSF